MIDFRPSFLRRVTCITNSSLHKGHVTLRSHHLRWHAVWNLWPHTRSKSGGGDDSKHTGHICTASLLALAAPMSSHNTHRKIVVTGPTMYEMKIQTVVGIYVCGLLIVLIFRRVRWLSGRQRVCGIVNIKTVIGICECGVLIVLIFRRVRWLWAG